MSSLMLPLVLSICAAIQTSIANKITASITMESDHDAFKLLSDDEIWSIRYQNRSATKIVQLDVFIDEEKSKQIQKLLISNESVLSFKILCSDIDAAINDERTRINNSVPWTSALLPDLFFEEYRSWNEYVLFMDALVMRHSDIASKQIIGQTIEGRDIPLITLSTDLSMDKPGFYIQAALHAREWLANAATMYILHTLTSEYGTNERITHILNACNFYIVPTVNVDGYIFSWTANGRLWRKNRRDNGGGSFGVDLNRNYDAADVANGLSNTWCIAGASTNPNSDTYCGTSAYSEPETRASRDFVQNLENNVSAVFDMHTYSQLILYPWSYTYGLLPPNEFNFYQSLGKELHDVIKSVNGIEYEAIQSSDLYPAAGTASDFSYGYGVERGDDIISFTFEGRPKTPSGGGFIVPPSNIIPAGEEQLAAVLKVAELLID